MPNELDYDKSVREGGITLLAGIDEAGRGPLAGPVVAAAVILPGVVDIDGVNDSKKLSPARRVRLDREIRAAALGFGLGEASEQEIDRMNILQATFLAMKRAVDALPVLPDYILVDGRQFPAFVRGDRPEPVPGKAVIRGDSRSLSIACASILAKVYRDRLMTEYAERYPGYGFERHKGYGTRNHREMLISLGPSPIHRRSFIGTFLRDQRELLKCP